MKKDKFVKIGFGFLKLFPIIILVSILLMYIVAQQRYYSFDLYNIDWTSYIDFVGEYFNLMPDTLRNAFNILFNNIIGDNMPPILELVCHIVWWWFIVWLFELVYKLILFIPNKLLGVLD